MKSKEKTVKLHKPSIARTALKLIHNGKLDTKEGKDEAAKVVAVVKKQFPKSKFSLTHYFWYLSRYRRQKTLGLKLDHLLVIKAKQRKAKTIKKVGKPKAKTAKALPKPTQDIVES